MSTRNDPAPETTAAALLMIVRTTFYVPREFPLPSFSLGFTDSSQEKIQTQEGQGKPEPQVEKSMKTRVLIEGLNKLVEKIAKSEVKTALNFTEGKSPPIKKQTVGQIFDKFETPGMSNLMSNKMKEKCYLWATRIRTYGDKSTDEYDLVCTLNAQQLLISFGVSQMLQNMTIGNYAGGEFLQPKSKKLFMIKDYPMFIPFLDLKKLASHPYHWWIWMADGYVISRIRIYARGTSQEKRSPTNIVEVDHFRVEFASRILFHEMNHDRDTAIRKSEAMRLSKPSAVLLNPYC
ncbi:hypothetical protein Ahy_B03g067122 [Arachis hypogaea]|uniref:Ubiquitin-like protease family profile domain-containing protein n=1 Tax=Arachis hypogaea TaxID=3818 RepID=A0A445A5X2_ARAHY|nr:hypothetical protein Ahy_B03g067122 [Arachis hypogaea]